MIEDIRKNVELLNKAVEALHRSMAVLEIWPSAFEHGRVSAHLTGNVDRPQEMRLVFKNEAEERSFPLAEVPKILRDRHVESLLVGAPIVGAGALLRRYIKKLDERELAGKDRVDEGQAESAEEEPGGGETGREN